MRLAILDALQAYEDQCAPDAVMPGTSAVANVPQMTGRVLAAQLQLHPATVCAHLRHIRLLVAQEVQETMADSLP
jgi:hypothetical protein